MDGRVLRRPGHGEPALAGGGRYPPPERDVEQDRVALFRQRQQRQGNPVHADAQPAGRRRMGVAPPEGVLEPVHAGAAFAGLRNHHRRERHGHLRGRCRRAEVNHHA